MQQRDEGEGDRDLTGDDEVGAPSPFTPLLDKGGGVACLKSHPTISRLEASARTGRNRFE